MLQIDQHRKKLWAQIGLGGSEANRFGNDSNERASEDTLGPARSKLLVPGQGQTELDQPAIEKRMSRLDGVSRGNPLVAFERDGYVRRFELPAMIFAHRAAQRVSQRGLVLSQSSKTIFDVHAAGEIGIDHRIFQPHREPVVSANRSRDVPGKRGHERLHPVLPQESRPREFIIPVKAGESARFLPSRQPTTASEQIGKALDILRRNQIAIDSIEHDVTILPSTRGIDERNDAEEVVVEQIVGILENILHIGQKRLEAIRPNEMRFQTAFGHDALDVGAFVIQVVANGGKRLDGTTAVRGRQGPGHAHHGGRIQSTAQHEAYRRWASHPTADRLGKDFAEPRGVVLVGALVNLAVRVERPESAERSRVWTDGHGVSRRKSEDVLVKGNGLVDTLELTKEIVGDSRFVDENGQFRNTQ